MKGGEDMNGIVIIPAYNPDEQLIELVNAIWNYGNQIIVVDDGSASNCLPIFKTCCDKAIIIHHETNRGKGAAIKTAFSYIQKEIWDADMIGIMDADGQHRPEDMEKVLNHAKNRKMTMILGVRKIDRNMPLKSRIGNQLTRKIFQIISGVKLTDTQTGMRAFDKNLIERLTSVDGERYEYETNVLFELVKEHISIEEVPIQTIYHDKNNSCSHFRAFRDSVRIYKDIIWKGRKRHEKTDM